MEVGLNQEPDSWSPAHVMWLGALSMLLPVWVPVSSSTKGKAGLDQVFRLCSLELQDSTEKAEDSGPCFHSLRTRF